MSNDIEDFIEMIRYTVEPKKKDSYSLELIVLNEEEMVETKSPEKVKKFKTIRVGDKDAGWVWKDIEIGEEK